MQIRVSVNGGNMYMSSVADYYQVYELIIIPLIALWKSK